MLGNMYRLLFPFWLKVDLDPILHGYELDTLAQRTSGKNISTNTRSPYVLTRVTRGYYLTYRTIESIGH